jgi:hypothetical protein
MHHAHARHEHQHSVQLNFPETSPPTLTRGRRGVACTLSLIASLLALLFLALIALEVPFVRLENRILESRMSAAPYRKNRSPVLNAVPITMGFWDENKAITALQLVVCLSLALDVDENHIAVQHEGAFFYSAIIESEGAWVIDAVNDEASMLLSALNAQASRFGAQLVLSHAARKFGVGSTAYPPPPPHKHPPPPPENPPYPTTTRRDRFKSQRRLRQLWNCARAG